LGTPFFPKSNLFSAVPCGTSNFTTPEVDTISFYCPSTRRHSASLIPQIECDRGHFLSHSDLFCLSHVRPIERWPVILQVPPKGMAKPPLRTGHVFTGVPCSFGLRTWIFPFRVVSCVPFYRLNSFSSRPRRLAGTGASLPLPRCLVFSSLCDRPFGPRVTVTYLGLGKTFGAPASLFPGQRFSFFIDPIRENRCCFALLLYRSRSIGQLASVFLRQRFSFSFLTPVSCV